MHTLHQTNAIWYPPPPAAAVRPLPPPPRTTAHHPHQDITLCCRGVDPESRALVQRIYTTLGKSLYRERVRFCTEGPLTRVRIRFGSQLESHHCRIGLIVIQDTLDDLMTDPLNYFFVPALRIETDLVPHIRALLPF